MKQQKLRWAQTTMRLSINYLGVIWVGLGHHYHLIRFVSWRFRWLVHNLLTYHISYQALVWADQEFSWGDGDRFLSIASWVVIITVILLSIIQDVGEGNNCGCFNESFRRRDARRWANGVLDDCSSWVGYTAKFSNILGGIHFILSSIVMWLCIVTGCLRMEHSSYYEPRSEIELWFTIESRFHKS